MAQLVLTKFYLFFLKTVGLLTLIRGDKVNQWPLLTVLAQYGNSITVVSYNFACNLYLFAYFLSRGQSWSEAECL